MSSPAPVFAGRTVTDGFKLVEAMLNEFVSHVPYCTEHQDVWSPRLTTVLLEACGQLDSLWRFEATYGPAPITPSRGNLDITDYYRGFGGRMAPAWVVFWGEEGTKLEPFSPWSAATYCPLSWWSAYNHVKHDRLINRRKATLQCSVEAVAALFLAILKSPLCTEAVAHEGWIPSPSQADQHRNVIVAEGPLLVDIKVAESAMMSYLLKEQKEEPAGQHQVVCDSYRFYLWYKKMCTNPDYVFD